jgi:hypothetical protein
MEELYALPRHQPACLGSRLDRSTEEHEASSQSRETANSLVTVQKKRFESHTFSNSGSIFAKLGHWDGSMLKGVLSWIVWGVI